MESPEPSWDPALPEHTHVEVRRGEYLDSVTLLQVSRAVGQLPGVLAAQVAMATELNVEVLRGMGFDVPGGLEGSDLVVAVRATSAEALTEARAGVEGELAAARGGGEVGGFGGEPAPRTTAAAVARSGADLALVSVAGPYAAAEAFDALAAGVSVMVFSDNVSVADEVALKSRAAEVGALVMGPDCGTAIVGGAALGFANVVRSGSVGVVAASGTGAQQVTCLLDAAGVGLSHCLGVGGRDLSAAVGGRSTRAALAALDADPQTTAILVVSKPPAPDVLADLQAYAATLATPVIWATLGAGRPDLTASVDGFLGGDAPAAWPHWGEVAGEAGAGVAGGSLRGLFCGGTLADEAMLIATPVLGPVRSNIPLSPELAVGSDLSADGHLVIDFGDDGLTQGRAHPMIDPTLRNARLRREGADPSCGVLLMDLVLGYGAHPDPADELAAAITDARATAAATGRDLPVVVAVVGTEGDPQGLRRSAETLVAAGAQAYLSSAQATRAALAYLGVVVPDEPSAPRGSGPSGGQAERGIRADEWRLTAGVPVVATAGAALFAESLRSQGVSVTEADWAPPLAGIDPSDVTAALADPRRAEANATAYARMTAAGAVLVDVRPASEALGLERGTFLHAGPPLEWERASGPMRGALIGAMLLEGLASTPEEAEQRLAAGDGITLEPCHHRDAVGPMAGVISPSMWLYELHDPVHDNRSWCSLNEGLGKVLRYGAYGPEVIDRLRWMTAILGPLLRQAVLSSGGIDIRTIIAQMLQMGDEGHNRNRAGSLLLLRELLPGLITADGSPADIAEAVRFSGANEHFFLNLGMPAAKLATLAAHGVPGSSLVTTMARNGTDFGIRVSGLGERWFTGPANTPVGLFLGSYGPQDANPDIGDSAITETGGFGGFAMAAAPAIVRFVGGDVPFALDATRRMYAITHGEHPAFQVPILEFRGTPTGIDAVSVARTGILPQINTGMAGAVAGTGQVGAGLVTPPPECFAQALAALAADARGAAAIAWRGGAS